ncbi:hypothetical protein NBH00_16525 [Paraconexibacter antarcticus]|uniref:Uncharacterized protein n=1 Tax=Paraconexibacter antarcticus TaxID=2949664 RepID=A0ABY5DM14_9ACTN|nr:hypothetical protein [Paraconexibacter antarcticus]UTI62958.1 hypothetical protein NBH00_16525 [Paraconexibacter antarcticus]
MPPPTSLSPTARDRALRRTRTVHRVAGVAVAGATAGLSLLASHAFKGHTGTASAAAATVPPAAAPAPAPAARPATAVPPPQAVPPIAGDPAPLEPPPSAPSAAPQSAPQAAQPAPAPPPPPPVVTGGS